MAKTRRAIYTCDNCGAFILGASPAPPEPVPCFACEQGVMLMALRAAPSSSSIATEPPDSEHTKPHHQRPQISPTPNDAPVHNQSENAPDPSPADPASVAEDQAVASPNSYPITYGSKPWFDGKVP